MTLNHSEKTVIESLKQLNYLVQFDFDNIALEYTLNHS